VPGRGNPWEQIYVEHGRVFADVHEDVERAEVHERNIYEPLPYADGFFDAVVSVQVIHHARIAAIRRLVDEITRVLKPGGLVFVISPSPATK